MLASLQHRKTQQKSYSIENIKKKNIVGVEVLTNNVLKFF